MSTFRSELFPTEGNPRRTTEASPDFLTVNPYPAAPPLLLASCFSFKVANLALYNPIACWVFLLYFVVEINFSSSIISSCTLSNFFFFS